MSATTTREPGPAGGGPAARWSPARLGHHRYLWWAGSVLLAALAVAIAVESTDSPESGITDAGALTVVVAVGLLAPVLVWMTGAELVGALRSRVSDDVRTYGVGQAVRGAAPPPDPDASSWWRPAEDVLLHVEVDHVPDAARVVERAAHGSRHRFLETDGEELRLRSGRGTLTAVARAGPVRHRATRRTLPGRYRARWEIDLDGRRLTCDVRGIQAVPRRTLLEPDGTAWLVQMGVPSLLDQLRGGRAARLRPHGRLPEDLTPDAVAFCLWLFCELETHQERVRSYGRDVGATAPEPVADTWTGHDEQERNP